MTITSRKVDEPKMPAATRPTIDQVRRDPDRLVDPRFQSNRQAFDGRTRRVRELRKRIADLLEVLKQRAKPIDLPVVESLANVEQDLAVILMRKSRGLPIDADHERALRGEQRRYRMALGLMKRTRDPVDQVDDCSSLGEMIV